MNRNSRRWQTAARLLALVALVGPVLAACGGFVGTGAKVKRNAFTSAEYGVAVSPRVTNNPNPPRGGGRYLLGKPYTVRGKVYTPREQPDYVAQGSASWYGSDFHGRRTANGEIFSANAISGAHPTLPLPSYVRVTNLENGRSVLVRINDRGPYLHGRVVDLSHRAAEILGYVNKGSANVQVDYVGPAPLNGDDTRMLLASVNRPTAIEQGTTRLAMADPVAVQPATRVNVADIGDTKVTTTFGGATEVQVIPKSQGDYSSDDLLGDFLGLFSYADAQTEDAAITNAHDAVNAMATRAGALDEWVAAVDEDARAIKLRLGVFSDSAGAIEVAESFAVLGAVEEAEVAIGNRVATQLTLTRLKPGVSRADVLDLAQELGLRDIVLY